MKLYLDTEFNEFGGQLISMALVSADGDEFYEVLNCANPGPWVNEHVMPHLNKKPISQDIFTALLIMFLNRWHSVEIIADWPDDIKYLCQALIVGPGMCIKTPEMMFSLRRDLSSQDSAVPHNALHDAWAIRNSDMQPINT